MKTTTQKDKHRAGTAKTETATSVCLRARVAGDLMTPSPVSIHDSATTREAADFLYKRKIGAAPVIDEAGRPVGVVSLSDIAWYHRAKDGHFQASSEYFQSSETSVLAAGVQEPSAAHLVRDIMTPAVFSVGSDMPMLEALEEMVRSKVHRLFVVDNQGTLIGVLSAFDVVKGLCRK